MKAQSNDPKQIELASGFTVADYESAGAQDSDKVAEALRRRFTERYIEPVTPSDDKCNRKPVHGFTIMAVSCLLIESFESFRQGWANSNGQSQLAFCLFFDGHNDFATFRGHAAQFYKNVRCGILHQAETTGGWKITRKERTPLFDPGPLPTINAILFLKHLRTVIDSFCDSLKTADWDSSEEWRNVHKKMRALCKNCYP